ncbi:hypothetical protein CPB85DRAFT_238779 [Mucidula mucida]|nr:hypothetical protein CPB85DRAFT_238779 [Mucidula mucida]
MMKSSASRSSASWPCRVRRIRERYRVSQEQRPNQTGDHSMDPCISLDMQDAYDLGPIMSPLPCDSISIDTMVPSTLGYWDSLLRAESPDPLDTISDERNNELLASDDDLDPLAFTDPPMTRHSLEQITTVFLAKATLDKVIFDAETDRIEPIEALKELRRVSDMLAEILDGFGDD